MAISVSGERLAKAEAAAQTLRIRANAALTGFINALVVSLFALVPDGGIGTTSLVVAIVGLLFGKRRCCRSSGCEGCAGRPGGTRCS